LISDLRSPEPNSDHWEQAEVGCFVRWCRVLKGAGQEQPEVSAVVDEVDALDVDELAIDLLHDLHRDRSPKPSGHAHGGQPASSS